MFIDLIDDLRGGPKTQMLAWADATLRAASDALAERGVGSSMQLAAIMRVDEELAASLALASMLVSRASPDDAPEQLREQCELMWSSAQRVMATPVERTNATYVREMKRALDAGVGRDYSDALRAFQVGPGPSQRRPAMQAMGVALHGLFVNPALGGGLLEVDEVFDRPWLPLRIARGARWDANLDAVVGGPGTLDLDTEFAEAGHLAPVYHPFIWKDAPPVVEGGWLVLERLYLTNPRDWLAAFIDAALQPGSDSGPVDRASDRQGLPPTRSARNRQSHPRREAAPPPPESVQPGVVPATDERRVVDASEPGGSGVVRTEETVEASEASVSSDHQSPGSCARSGCTNHPVLKADLCRAHLLLRLRSEGIFVPGGGTDLAEMAAAVIHLAGVALESPPNRELASGGSPVGIDMHATIDPEASWQVAQLALDVLGSHLIDEPPFMRMSLEPPMAFGPDVVLRLRVDVPASVVDDLRPRLESLLYAVVRETVGGGARITCLAEADDSR